MTSLFKGVYPIGDTNPAALPVRDVPAALGYYTQVLGFEVVSREKEQALLRRDEAEVGLEVNDKDPLQASCFFEVSDVEALRAELDAKGIEPTAIRVDRNEDGGGYRLFFVREPYGVCFCFGQSL